MLARFHVEAFIVDQLEPWKPSTASVRFKSLQQFLASCLGEGEISSSPMVGVQPPSVPEPVVPVVPDDAIRVFLKSCSGRAFERRRDAAIVRVFTDTGCRVAELAGVQLPDVDFDLEVILIAGKGDRARMLPIGPSTAVSIDRYLRARAQHPSSPYGSGR